MPNPSEPGRGGTPQRPGFDPRESRTEPSDEWGAESGFQSGDDATESVPLVPSDSETETVVINRPDPRSGPQEIPDEPQRERVAERSASFALRIRRLDTAFFRRNLSRCAAGRCTIRMGRCRLRLRCRGCRCGLGKHACRQGRQHTDHRRESHG